MSGMGNGADELAGVVAKALRILGRLIVIVLALAILAGIGVGAWLGYWSWQEAKVTATVGEIGTEICDNDPRFVIPVAMRNDSFHTVERVSFRISVKEIGRSTELTGFTYYSSDFIMTPGEVTGQCWLAPNRSGQTGGEDRNDFSAELFAKPAEYDVTARVTSVQFD